MAVFVKRQTTNRAGRDGFSPVGYYRLGQSYPRTQARLTYPRAGGTIILSGVPAAAIPGLVEVLIGATQKRFLKGITQQRYLKGL